MSTAFQLQRSADEPSADDGLLTAFQSPPQLIYNPHQNWYMAPYNPRSQFIPPPQQSTMMTLIITSQQVNMQNQLLQSTMGYQQVQMQQLHETSQSALIVNQVPVQYPHVEKREVPEQDSSEEEDAPAKKKRNMSGPSQPRPSVPARQQKNVTRDEPQKKKVNQLEPSPQSPSKELVVEEVQDAKAKGKIPTPRGD